MNIKIFVRHCKFSANSVGKNRPSWFDREGCFNNLLNTVDPDCEVNVCFDGNLKGSDHFVEKLLGCDLFCVHEKIGGNDGASFLNTLEFAYNSNFSDKDIIYFTEDDYLHNTGWPNILREGFTATAADYITLYDHNDKYWFAMYEQLMSKVICTKSVHWRSIPNTTNTYACLGKTFRRDYEIHRQFCDLARGFTRDFDKFERLAELGKTLISPMPGYSTHCEPEFMSPVVDWQQVFENTSTL
jgi:hypothetical protein